MTAAETIKILAEWTPYLLTGFGWNIVVSLTAMAIGTVAGLLLAVMRDSSVWGAKSGGNVLTAAMHVAPTFVMLFYLTYMIPEQLEFFGLSVHVPVWLKASLAFGIAVAGFVSDNALVSIRYFSKGHIPEALLFLPSWTNYFLIIVMASSTASVIGVPEMVYRARTVIGAVDQIGFLFWAYLYVMIWFLVFSILLTMIMHLLRNRLTQRTHGLGRQDETDLGGIP